MDKNHPRASQSSDPGLGITPGNVIKTRADEPTGWILDIPESMVSLDWGVGPWSAADLTFKIIETTPASQEKAAKFGGTNQAALARELAWITLYRIGDWDPQRNRDKLESWWKAIGPKGRGMVEAVFVKLHTVLEVDKDSFLSSMRPG